ncbi:MAG: hypothetical protein Q7S15_01565 [bacterium]|nr:hypothetical protein [bacterium]
MSATANGLLKRQVLMGEEESKLAQAFRELDVRPFTPESVEAYQREQVRIANKEFTEQWIETVKRDAIKEMEVYGTVTLVLLVLSAISVIAMLQALTLGGEVNDIAAKCGVGFLAIMAFALPWTAANTWRELKKYRRPEFWASFRAQFMWLRTALDSYFAAVPEFALQTVEDLKMRLPEAEFYVEHLQNDPFLVMYCDGETYHLEVWDEPGFGRERPI